MPVPLINNLVKLHSGLARAVQQGLLGLGQTCGGWARPMRTPPPPANAEALGGNLGPASLSPAVHARSQSPR